MGKIAVVAGGALSAALLKTASEMEKLYFSAQRAGTSVQGLMGIRYAAEQIGVGAEAAQQGITGLATAIRTNPGLRLFFTQLGLKDTGDNTKNFINLISKLQGLSSQGPMGHAIATQIASQFGIDEQTLFMYEKHLPELIQAQKDFQRLGLLGGIDVDKQSEQFHQFMVDVRKLLATVELLAIAFGGQLLPYAEKLVHFLQRGAEFLLRMHQATHGLSTLFGGLSATLASIFGATKVLGAIGGLFSGGGAAAAAGGGVAAAGEAAGGGILALVGGTAGILAIVAAVAAIAVGWLAYHYRDKIAGAASAVGGGLAGFWQSIEGKSLKAYRDIAGHLTIGYGHKIKPGENFEGGIDDNRALQLLAEDVKTASDAVRRLVHVQLSKNQMQALTSFAYNVGTGAFAHSTLLKDLNAGNFAAASNEFTKWNLANGVPNRGLTNRRLGEQSLFNKPDVTMNQNTTVQVNGSNDARLTASLVAQQQRSVNGDLVRDMAAKVQ
ncbi:MAG TPA: glycoside hydrolase family protein [Candidatus Binatia bacterium]|nr:glycoside hydrolase family protein [Candidatus Binatia bacterium]